jgi:RNA polymerase sigma-54 factor
MNLQELRQAIVREMSQNPVIEDVEHPLEVPMNQAQTRMESRDEAVADMQPYDEATPSVNPDEDAAERRQRFFDSQVDKETLQSHLIKQIPSSDIPKEDHQLAEILIGYLNDDGYFKGSMPDIVMISGSSESHVLGVLAAIQQFDPPGCGARTPQECLLAQMDRLEDSPWEEEVRALIERHFEDMAKNRVGAILDDLGITRAEYAEALKELRTLEPRPGRAYEGSGGENRIVKPEVHAVRRNGRWVAEVDDRSLPDIHISKKYLKMLEDPNTTKETRDFIHEKIARVNQLNEAIEHREETIRQIAQEIFDRQPGFFTDGLKGIAPLTMREVAEKVGVHPTTVSRTVNDKYASTPRGAIELRRFFTQGVAMADGEVVAKDQVYDELKKLIDSEDKRHPLSDEKLMQRLVALGYPVKRRTVAKYRDMLGIPGTSERRMR